ncbi:MAG: pyrroline-5-carboxylate reductase [Lentisphaerae bacterium]|nr:pyrroline-5-carboxylate reductase [Lentisphaerota bacterium]
MVENMKIGFLGAGKMASAIAGGMVKGSFNAENIFAYDTLAAAGDLFQETIGANIAANPVELAEKCDALLLAVKPQYLAEALKPIAGMLKNKLIISIVAGVTLEKLGSLTGASRIVRVMPNTPALVGCGCGAYTLTESATADDRALAKNILESAGEFFELPEKQLDAVTAVSGCGPAYVYELIQAMADGGVTLGLPRALAQLLAAATVRGAAEMVLQNDTHPIELRDQVCSPGGATICAVNILSAQGFNSAVVEAEIAAYQRSIELGKA